MSLIRFLSQALPAVYVQQRGEWFATALNFARAFCFKDETTHDAMLLLDRAIVAAGGVLPGSAGSLIAACLLIAARQGRWNIDTNALVTNFAVISVDAHRTRSNASIVSQPNYLTLGP